MNAESCHAITLLAALDGSRARLREFTNQMLARHRQLLKSADARISFSSFDCLHSIDGLDGMIHIEAHAAPIDGPCVWWSIELSWNQMQWFVDANVSIDSDSKYGGADYLIEFPQRVTQTLDECLAHLKAATDDLLTSGDIWEILKTADTKNTK